MDPFRRGVLLALRLRNAQSVSTAYIRDEFGMSVAAAKRDRAALLELADPMSLLDTLLPANAPEPKGARTVRPMDRDRDDEHESEPIPMNNKAASLRALLSLHSEGMDYDQMSRATGIERDKIAGHVAGLITTGDAKPYELNGRRFFKFSGDPAKVGPRIPQPGPRLAATPPVPKTETAAPLVP